jgi:ElaB/YqjD/DUF883 family membrane-anchored ribosome-binding protein
MNARNLRAPIALLTLALTSTGVLAEDEKTTGETVKEKASEAVQATKEGTKKAAHSVAQTTRRAWKKTKAYFSEEPTTYRKGATGSLQDLGSEIARLKEESGGASGRDYFATRIQSLEQQHKYAEDQLAALNEEDIKSAKESKRRQFNQTMDRLEQNIDLAEKEAKDFGPTPHND